MVSKAVLSSQAIWMMAEISPSDRLERRSENLAIVALFLQQAIFRLTKNKEI
jgi:hypothetical protein